MSTATPASATVATPTSVVAQQQPSATVAPQQTAEVPLPNPTCLVQASRLAIQQDKPIQLDYYHASATSKAFLGEDPETKEKVLVKSKEEFTSLVQKLYKVGDDYIILTENSLYVVSGKIQKRKVNLAALQGE